MFAEKNNYTHKNRPVLGLKHREDDDDAVTAKHCGVDVGSVYSKSVTTLMHTGTAKVSIK